MRRSSRFPCPPPHRLHYLLGIQVADVTVGRRQAGVAKLLLNDVDWRPFVRKFVGVRSRRPCG